MVENCPSCKKDLSNLTSDTKNCPYCGAKLEADLWDELFDEEKQREILRKMRERKEQRMRKLRRFALVVGLNVILFFAAWSLYLVSLRHWLGVGLAIGLVAVVLLFDLLILYTLIFKRK